MCRNVKGVIGPLEHQGSNGVVEGLKGVMGA